MKLQIAIDTADMERVLKMADQIHDVIDIVEVGTPVIMKYGVEPVRRIKEKYPDLTVLADTKIADAGEYECQEVCDSGADIITVMAFADDGTIKAVADTAHRNGRQCMVDLLSITDIASRAKQLEKLGADIICVHTGVDMQAKGRTPLKDLQELVGAVAPGKCAVAGGVGMPTLAQYTALKPGIIISGGALSKAPDLRKAVIEMEAAL
jgi:3-hexulose-6-phosphate synthase